MLPDTTQNASKSIHAQTPSQALGKLTGKRFGIRFCSGFMLSFCVFFMAMHIVSVALSMPHANAFAPSSTEEAKTQSLQSIEKVAKQGDPRAQRKLGMMYYEGEGVTQDAEQTYGNADARFMLGVMYPAR